MKNNNLVSSKVVDQRRRRHSAPGSFTSHQYDINRGFLRLINPSFAHLPQPLKDPSTDLKVSFQHINRFIPKSGVTELRPPPWMNKKNNAENIYPPKLSEIAFNGKTLQDGKTFAIKKEIVETKNKCFGEEEAKNEVDSAWQDAFIDVEWDIDEVAEIKRKQYEIVENQQNVKAQEILVLKPKWLQNCKKVIFRDCHVDLVQLEPKNESTTTMKKEKLLAKSKYEKDSEGCKRDSKINDNPCGVPILKMIERRKNEFPVTSEIKSSKTQHRCELCSKTCRSNQLLFRHILWHTGEKPYKCDHCGKRFRLSYKLKMHERIHTGERPYKCQTCGMEFRQSDHLKDHIRRGSHIKKVYKCGECKESFAQIYQRIIHVGLVHKGVKPHHCRFCGRKFCSISSLYRHTKHGCCKGSKSAISKN